MLPARDMQEYKLFPQEDLSFVHDWLKWTDDNVDLLKLTRPVPSLSTPGAGQADGTIMLRGDEHAGYSGAMFLFNPTSREINVSLPLSGDGSAALGFSCIDSTPPVVVRQAASSERTSAPFILGIVDCAGVLNLTLPATSARVLGFDRWNGTATPLLLGAAYSKAEVDSTGTLTVTAAHGESGTPAQLTIVLPKGTPKITTAVINGEKTPKFHTATTYGLPAVALEGAWTGVRFSRAQEIAPSSSSDTSWTGHFSVPQGVIDQLRARNASYPIVYNTDPQDSDDANVPWLAPGRLLIFIKYDSPIDDTLNITGAIDGHPLLVRKAYNTIVRNPGVSPQAICQLLAIL